MKKGISLIVLVVTVIVMIVLAGAVIISVNGSGIIERTQKAKFLTEISEIQELVNIQKSMNPKIKYDYGTLDSIIEIDETNRYKNMLYMENGKLVYNEESVTEKEAKWLEEQGIMPRQNIIPIYTLEQFEKIASKEKIEIDGIEYTFNADSIYYLQNDIDFDGTAENPNKMLSSFSGVLDGQGYSLTNIYINGTAFETSGLIQNNYGTIRNLQLVDSILFLPGINSRTVC